MGVRAAPAAVTDYDPLSRFAVRLNSLPAAGVSVVLAVLFVAGVLAYAAATLPTNLAAAPMPIRVASIGVGTLFVIAGVIGVRQRPRSPVGALLVVVGFAYLVGRLQGADPPGLGLAANLANSVWQGIIFYITYSFPTGRLRSPVDRWIVIGGLGYTLVNNLFVLVTSPTRAAPGLNPQNPWFLALPQTSVELVRPILLVIGYALIFGGTAWLTRRWLASSPPMRRVLTPVYVSALATGLVAVLLRATLGVVSPSTDPTQAISVALLIAYGFLPIGFLVGLLRAQIARAAVADLVIELGDLPTPPRLRIALAAALHDPTLDVITWSGERNAFVDTAGEIAQVPIPDSDRAVTVLERAGDPSAILVHDSAILDDPGLVTAVATAVRLTLDNERLETEVGRQLDEVRASRARVAAAADDARRRIERDIHDGTQQRLLGVALGLQDVRGRLNSGTPEAAALDEMTDQLQSALTELRQLAQGVHPAVLTQHGLGPALRGLARRSPIPVELVLSGPEERLAQSVEAALYFIASAALSNAQAHSRASQVVMRVDTNGNEVQLSVRDDGQGGAREGRGTGITGMRDRAETVGGRLAIDSPRGGPTEVRAFVPVEGR